MSSHEAKKPMQQEPSHNKDDTGSQSSQSPIITSSENNSDVSCSPKTTDNKTPTQLKDKKKPESSVTQKEPITAVTPTRESETTDTPNFTTEAMHDTRENNGKIESQEKVSREESRNDGQVTCLTSNDDAQAREQPLTSDENMSHAVIETQLAKEVEQTSQSENTAPQVNEFAEKFPETINSTENEHEGKGSTLDLEQTFSVTSFAVNMPASVDETVTAGGDASQVTAESLSSKALEIN